MNFKNLDAIIGNRLNSDRSGEAFRKCSLCDRQLGPEDHFVIAKAYGNGKSLLETVQCLGCRMEPQEYASEQSIENIMLYSGRRFQEFLQDSLYRKLYFLEDPSCLITKEPIASKDAFELYTFNLPGSGLEVESNYILVGPTAMEQMSELLSEETRREWGKYLETIAPEMPDIIISPVIF